MYTPALISCETSRSPHSCFPAQLSHPMSPVRGVPGAPLQRGPSPCLYLITPLYFLHNISYIELAEMILLILFVSGCPMALCESSRGWGWEAEERFTAASLVTKAVPSNHYAFKYLLRAERQTPPWWEVSLIIHILNTGKWRLRGFLPFPKVPDLTRYKTRLQVEPDFRTAIPCARLFPLIFFW